MWHLFSIEFFPNSCSFSSLPRNATFVDMGGSRGGAAIQLSQANPAMRCVVQDMAESTIAARKANLPRELLKNLIPAIKRGSRIVVNDVCFAKKGMMTLY